MKGNGTFLRWIAVAALLALAVPQARADSAPAQIDAKAAFAMLKTLAGKHGSTAAKMGRVFRTAIDTPHGPRTCFEATVARSSGRKPLVARFGGIPLRRQTTAILTDRPPPSPTRRKELIDRLLTGRCELCQRADDIEVHHVRKLAEVDTVGLANPPAWMHLMTRRRRKTLVVCRPCHATIHPGQPATPLTQ